MKAIYKVKRKICPACGKEFECLSQPGCSCERPDHDHTIPAPCPCPECVKALAEKEK